MRSALIAALVLACGCVNNKSQVRIGPMTMKLRHGQLPSGARVIIEEARGTGAVCVALIVNAGSEQDPQGKEGLAHLVQHLSFKSKPAGKVTQAQGFELLGASRTLADTHFSDTRFEVLAQARLAPQVVSLLAQQLGHPVDNIDPQVFEAERDAARLELIDQTESGYPGAALGALQQLLYPAGDRLTRPQRGTEATLGALSLEDAKKWAQEHYRVGEATLVVLGDFDSEAMQQQVLEALPPEWLAQGVPRAAHPPVPRPPEPPPAPPEPVVVPAAVQRSELLLSWSLPPATALVVPPEYMAGSLETALNFDFENHAPGVAHVDCEVQLDPISSTMLCLAPLRPGADPAQSFEALYRRVGSGWYQSMHITRRSVAQVYLDRVFRNEGLLTRAAERAEGWHYTGDPFALTQRFEELKQQDDDSLNDIAKAFLTRERMRAVLVNPLEAAPTHPAGAAEPLLQVQVPAEAVREEAEGPNLVGLRRFTLSNGLRVLVVPRPAMPVATLTLGLPGGRARGTRGAAFLSELLSNEDLSVATGRVTVTHRDDVTLVRIQGANGNLEALLDNLRLWLVREATIEDQTRTREWLERNADKIVIDEEQKLAEAFWGALYRGSRFDPSFDREALRNLKLADAVQWRQGVFQPALAELVISGDIDPMRMRDLAEQNLATWSGSGDPLGLQPAPSLEPKPIVVQVNAKPGAALASLTLGCLVPSPEPKDALAPTVLGAALDSRLTRLWQSELHAAYGVSSHVEDDGPLSAVVVSARLDPSRLLPALTAFKQQWDQHELPEYDSTMARWTVARTRSTAATNSQSLGLYFAAPGVRSQDQLGAVEQEHRLAEFSTGVVQREFDACRGTTVLRIDGDEALIKKALSGAGL